MYLNKYKTFQWAFALILLLCHLFLLYVIASECMLGMKWPGFRCCLPAHLPPQVTSDKYKSICIYTARLWVGGFKF